ncbi:MAG TPA: hypothetical protein VKQ08_03025, partial [Cyclobacteriaceae bacterium]|nr:hypothetical protein [Cyclobacteriaceae bacterium]
MKDKILPYIRVGLSPWSLQFLMVILASVLIGACQFEPVGSPMTVLKRPDSTGLTIDLGLLHNNDSIFLYTDAQFNYHSVLPGNQQVQFIGAYINGLDILATQAPAGSFIIQPEYYQSGTYTLTVEMQTNSGT